MKRIAAIAFALLFLCPAAHAAHPAAEAADPSVKGFIDLFDRSCLAYAGRIPRLRVWLDGNLKIANPKQTDYFLGEDHGKVWLQENEAGNYAVVIDEAGLCTVKAERAPVDDAARTLESDTRLKKVSDAQDGSFMGASGRIVTYEARIGGAPYTAILIGKQQRLDPLQAQLSLEPPGQQ